MPNSTTRTTNLTVRVPNEHLAALRERATDEGVSVASLMIEASVRDQARYEARRMNQDKRSRQAAE